MSPEQKLYMLTMLLVGLKAVKTKKGHLAYLVAILIGAQPTVDAACIEAAGGPMSLEYLRMIKDNIEQLKLATENVPPPTR